METPADTLTTQKLRSITPNLGVADMAASVAFYTQRLGFQVVTSVPEAAPYAWAMLARDGVQLMLQTRESLQEEYSTVSALGAAPLSIYVQITGPAELYATLREAGVPLLKELPKTFYGADEFALQDPDGYVLTIAA